MLNLKSYFIPAQQCFFQSKLGDSIEDEIILHGLEPIAAIIELVLPVSTEATD